MDSRSARERVEARSEELYEAFKVRREQLKAETGLRISMAFAARDHFERPPGMTGVGRDIDAWAQAEARIWDVSELERAREEEAVRARKQQELFEANAAKRSDLLVGAPRALGTDEVELDFEATAQSTEQVGVEPVFLEAVEEEVVEVPVWEEAQAG